MKRDEIVRKLRANTNAREKVTAQADRLYDERDTLYLAARHSDPPITVRELAECAGVTEVAVNKRLAQLRKDAALSA